MGNASTPSDAPASPRLSLWQRFWHVPLRAERLALMRILLGLALLVDQFLQTWPYLLDLFGPNGLAPAGLHEPTQYRYYNWTILFCYTDDPTLLYSAFGLWALATVLWTIGWQTRWMGVAVWFLTLCFIQRNPNILNSGDRLMLVGLFLLMVSPCGKALSVDAWLHRRITGDTGPVYTEAWPVRLLQLQLCMVYLATGLIKLKGDWEWGQPFEIKGTWWDGTTINDVLNFIHMNRYPYTWLPLPFWITRTMTYVTVWWEALFPLLVLFRYTRLPTLLLGIALHLGIYATVEVGGFSFFILSFYGVWVHCEVWRRWDQRRARAGA